MVRRCYEPGASSGVCRAVDDRAACPLDGSIDVALAVRSGEEDPTALEAGISCALRAGVPLVTVGDEADPFGSREACRVADDDDAVDACEYAADAAERDLDGRIGDALLPLLDRAGVERAAVRVVVGQRSRDRLVIDLLIDANVGYRLSHSLAVRAYEALRDESRLSPQSVDVHVAPVWFTP